jgi:hypothetical protein
MRVRIHRYADLRMAQDFHNHLSRDTLGKWDAGGRVSGERLRLVAAVA